MKLDAANSIRKQIKLTFGKCSVLFNQFLLNEQTNFPGNTGRPFLVYQLQTATHLLQQLRHLVQGIKVTG